MTFENAPVELLDLALELFYADEADTLDQALALAVDMDRTLGVLAIEWDAMVAPKALLANDFDTAFAALPF